MAFRKGVMKMKEIIIVAGKTKGDVCRLRHCLKEKGYSSIPCKSAEQILEELKILPTCDAKVSLMIIEPEILRNISDDSIARLNDFPLDIPFLLVSKQEVQVELAEIFNRICEYRTVFKQEQNPELTSVLTKSGIKVTCS